jgi:DNA-binding beta-propeller fold protein YncE
VADVSDVVVIDIKKNTIDHKIAISGAAGLNDITIDKNGIAYVTDSKNGTAYKIEGDNATLFLERQKGINGIKAVGDKIYVLTSDGMYLVGTDKKATKICTLEHGGDGIEPIGKGDFLVTAWIGYLYYVHADGTKDILLDTHESKNKTADIGYDPKARIIYVPTFLGKSVAAYKLN